VSSFLTEDRHNEAIQLPFVSVRARKYVTKDNSKTDTLQQESPANAR